MSDQAVESSGSDNDSFRMLSESDDSSDQDDNDSSQSAAWLDQEALQPFNHLETTNIGFPALCGACHSFFRGKKELEIKYNHLRFLSTLRDTARRGCRLCLLIIEKVDRETANHYPVDILNICLEINRPFAENEVLFDIWYYYRKGSKRPKYGNCVQGIERIRFLPRKGIVEPGENNHAIGTSTWSTETRQLAQQWIAQCVTSHVECNRATAKDQWLPTRLLDIQVCDGSETDVFLVDSKDTGRKAQYASLSHCWGRAPVLSLRAETMDLFRKGFPVKNLPKTFQQAIEVARYLQMGYIWIDSLCIIQGSIADWQVESLTMMSVYQNAFCNIAATGSDNSRGGLFFERDPSLVPVSTVNIRWDETPSQGEYCFYPDKLWIDGVASAPLNRRAWVVQERLLAKRVLHFGLRSLFFECCEHEACETFPKGLPHVYHNANNVDQFKRIYKTEKGSLNDPKMNHRLWERVVQAFMRSNLTHASDKTVSLSGIAEKFQETIIKDRYIAGLWETALEEQLLWRVVGERQANGTPSKRPSAYRAPSWSWLSIDASIYTSPPDFKPTLIEIQHAHIDLLDDNHTTGQLTGGYIIVSGHILPATHGSRTSSDPNLAKDYLLFDGCEIGTTNIF